MNQFIVYINGSSDIVTFYYNNVPEGISQVELRAEFGRCGALMDVFLARKRNTRGRRFGFVRFTKVRDKEKMVRALNQVWFGMFKVCANIPVFKQSEEKREEGGVRVVTPEIVLDKGNRVVVVEGNKVGSGGVMETVVNVEGMGTKGTFAAVVGNGRKLDTNGVGNTVTEVEKPLEKKEWCVRWCSEVEDRRWASNGVIGVVRNGVELATLQENIVNVGFGSLYVTYLGGRNIFINGSEGVDVSQIVVEAKEFSDKFLSSYSRWEPSLLIKERCVWFRIYGVPIHAWNPEFF